MLRLATATAACVVFSLPALVSAHGALSSINGFFFPRDLLTPQTPNYNSPVNISSPDFRCRGTSQLTPDLSVTAGSNLDIRWIMTEVHPGDCAIYLSYDNETSWMKLDVIQNCQVGFRLMPLPSYLPSCDRCVLRWEWLAYQNYPAPCEAYANCIDIKISGDANRTLIPSPRVAIPGHIPSTWAGWNPNGDPQPATVGYPGPAIISEPSALPTPSKPQSPPPSLSPSPSATASVSFLPPANSVLPPPSSSVTSSPLPTVSPSILPSMASISASSSPSATSLPIPSFIAPCSPSSSYIPPSRLPTTSTCYQPITLQCIDSSSAGVECSDTPNVVPIASCPPRTRCISQSSWVGCAFGGAPFILPIPDSGSSSCGPAVPTPRPSSDGLPSLIVHWTWTTLGRDSRFLANLTFYRAPGFATQFIPIRRHLARNADDGAKIAPRADEKSGSASSGWAIIINFPSMMGVTLDSGRLYSVGGIPIALSNNPHEEQKISENFTAAVQLNGTNGNVEIRMDTNVSRLNSWWLSIGGTFASGLTSNLTQATETVNAWRFKAPEAANVRWRQEDGLSLSGTIPILAGLYSTLFSNVVQNIANTADFTQPSLSPSPPQNPDVGGLTQENLTYVLIGAIGIPVVGLVIGLGSYYGLRRRRQQRETRGPGGVFESESIPPSPTGDKPTKVLYRRSSSTGSAHSVRSASGAWESKMTPCYEEVDIPENVFVGEHHQKYQYQQQHHQPYQHHQQYQQQMQEMTLIRHPPDVASNSNVSLNRAQLAAGPSYGNLNSTVARYRDSFSYLEPSAPSNPNPNPNPYI